MTGCASTASAWSRRNVSAHVNAPWTWTSARANSLTLMTREYTTIPTLGVWLCLVSRVDSIHLFHRVHGWVGGGGIPVIYQFHRVPGRLGQVGFGRVGGGRVIPVIHLFHRVPGGGGGGGLQRLNFPLWRIQRFQGLSVLREVVYVTPWMDAHRPLWFLYPLALGEVTLFSGPQHCSLDCLETPGVHTIQRCWDVHRCSLCLCGNPRCSHSPEVWRCCSALCPDCLETPGVCTIQRCGDIAHHCFPCLARNPRCSHNPEVWRHCSSLFPLPG